jgi:hypothetical protein
LVSSTLLLIPISAVNADCTRRALIWGSESTGDNSCWNGTNWVTGRKTSDEIYRQHVTSNAIRNYFADDQYTVDNYQGEGSIKYSIRANITDAETNYSKVAVVDFDHGVGRTDYTGDPNVFHYMFEDNVGSISGQQANGSDPNNWVNTHMVYDMDIYEDTDDKTFFAFINTCLSANLTYQDDTGHIQGMPLAWTHCMVTSNPGSGEISDDGYSDPDGSFYCYMGFPWGSAALSQTITGISPIYATWLEKFFWYAMSYDISVNDALDEASLYNFEHLFGDIDLATGFSAVWPMWNGEEWDDTPWPDCTLVVYGNGNIHLYEYFVHDYVDATWYGLIAGVDNPDGIEGGKNDDSYACLYAVRWYEDQAVMTGSIGWEAKGHIYLYGYTGSGYNSHVLVYVSYDYSNWYPVNTNLWVSQSSPGWIDVGSYSNNFRYISVVVYADYAPSVIYVDSVLVIPSLSHYWVSSIADYSWYGSSAHVYNPNYLVGSSNDELYAQIYAGNYGDQAMIVGAMNTDAHGHIELYGYSVPGYNSHLYVYVSYDYSNWYQVNSQTVYPGSAHWIDCGSYSSSFRYIAVVVYNDQGLSGNIYVDSVKATP